MKRQHLIYTLLLVLGLTVPIFSSAATRELPKQYTLEDKIYAFSYVWSEIKYNFVFIDQIDFNADSLYKSYLPRIVKTRNDVEFFDVMKRFVARFNDGHTVVYSPEDWAQNVMERTPVGIYELGGRYYLSQICEVSGLDSTALGAEIVKIEDAPTQQYVKGHYFPLIGAGSEYRKYHFAPIEMMQGLPGTSLDVELQYRDGHTAHVRIKRDYNRLSKKNGLGKLWNWAALDMKQHDAPVALDWPAKRIARLNFFSFDDASVPAVDSLLTKAAQEADGVIIDLRSCIGGSSSIGYELASRIIDADTIVVSRTRTRDNIGYGRAQGGYRSEYADLYNYRSYADPFNTSTLTIDRSQVLKCPVVILTSPVTVSACEDFLISIYELPNRPPIIGQQTSGSTGAPLVLDLPHGASARICTLGMLFPVSGKPFINDGIKPDIEIIPTVNDLMAGRDRVMEEALQIIDHEQQR